MKHIHSSLVSVLLVGMFTGLLHAADSPESARTTPDPFEAQRQRMVDQDLARSGFWDARTPVKDARVLDAMRVVPRHEFVPEDVRNQAYADSPLPIGYGQTISQPYIVAFMTELLEVAEDSVALEIGTGSGYQAAVLSPLVKEVYSIEIVPELEARAKEVLERLGYNNVKTKAGDGYHGWPEHGPYDAIIVTAAASHIPPPLVEQLKPGGRMAIPVGPVGQVQHLMLVQKQEDGSISQRSVMPVRFVPLTRARE